MKNIRIEGRRWFDRVNGNTYHASRVYVDGELVVAVPWQYGYGDQYVWTGWLALVDLLKLDIERHENGSSDHNEMVAYGDDLLHAWACAKCGYIYGQAERAEGKEE